MQDVDAYVARYLLTESTGSGDAHIDETTPDLDPTDEPPAPAHHYTVRYSDRFGSQVRALGGLVAEASLIIHVAGS